VAAIETKGLTKYYGAVRGIEEVTMTVERGEVFGFLGPNGAGKTTTIRTLLDLLHPTRGSARLFGLDSRRDSVAVRARLGNLPGDFGYGRDASGREALALLARLRGVRDLGRAERLAERFRAELDRPLGQLSRGNRQKVGLILAAFHRPELLILDEPTSGLDPLMQEQFLALVREERERGCAVFLSSHELDEVERVCDRVGIIRGGRLIAVERIGELLGRAQRRVSVEFDERPDAAWLSGVPGVADLELDGDRVRFHLGGDPDPLLKALAAHPVVEIEIAHPTLEEVFLTYYEEEGGNAGGGARSGAGMGGATKDGEGSGGAAKDGGS
jgi:ABC-2 type transport system ATP-binding protein